MLIDSIIDLLPALPTPPWMGPPLPIAWGLRWQVEEEPEVKLPSGSPRRYVLKATVKKSKQKKA